MREIINYSFEQNLGESLQAAELLYRIYTSPKPTIARVNGTVLGGGTGFMSACDIVVASEKAKFGLSEAKLGLVPALISPYIIRRMGDCKAKEYILTGERLTAPQAREIGLVNDVVPHDKLDEKVDEKVKLLLSSGPGAIAITKEMLLKVPGMEQEEVKKYTANLIANLRISDEAQEGMAAFLEKRKTKWAKDSEKEDV
jgi:methylglutaconyl-CoA hydratase